MLDDDNVEGAITFLSDALGAKQNDDTLLALDSLLDDALFARAQATSTGAGFAAYLDARPSGSHVAEARSDICRLTWDDVKASTDPAVLMEYVADHKACPQSEQAESNASAAAFKQTARTSAAMHDFLKAWPRAMEAAEAKGVEDELAYAEATMTTGTTALRSYVINHPTGARVRDAVAAMDERSWDAAVAVGGIEAISAFAQQFPSSSHQAEARAMIRQVATGLFRLAGDDWAAMDAGPWKRGTLVYRPPKDGAAPAAIEIWGLHETPSGSAPSAVAFPLGRWAGGLLGVDAASLERPRIAAKPVGSEGEYAFDLPLDLPQWSLGGARVAGYELRVLNAKGGMLVAAQVQPGEAVLDVSAFLVGGAGGQRLAADAANDVLDHAAVAAMKVEAGDYAGAAQEWAAVTRVWPTMPASPPGLMPTYRQGSVYTARAEATAAPGTADDGFEGVLSVVAGVFRLGATAHVSGTLLLDDGRVIGTAQVGSGRATGWRSGKPAWTGTVALEGVNPTTVFGHDLFVVHQAGPKPATETLASVLDRWPGLKAMAGSNPAAWLAAVMQGVSVRNPRGPYDLDGDGLPEFVGQVQDQLVVASLHADGRVTVAQVPPKLWTPLAGLIETDLNGDGRPELLFPLHQGCGGYDLIAVGNSQGLLGAVDITISGGDCGCSH